MKYIDAAKELADTIGNVDPEMIAEVLEIADRQKYLFHGTKNKNILQINRDGVLPLTPEGGRASFWNLGPAAFDVRAEHVGSGLGTAFFDYANSNDGVKRYGNLAIARADDLGLTGRLDSEVRIHFPVPRNKIELLHVEIEPGKTQLEPRKYGQILEREMLELVYKTVKNGYKPGVLSMLRKTA